MTVDNSNNRIDHVPDGIVSTFVYDFRVDEASHLVVYADGEVVTEGYTVLGVGEEEGGDVSFDVAPSADIDTLTFIREVPSTQETAYPVLGPFPAESHEAALDKITFLIQQLEERFERVLSFPVNLSTGAPLSLPTPQAGYYMRWLGDLSGLENVPFTSQSPGNDSLTVSSLANVTDADTGDWRYVLGKSTIGDGGHGAWVLIAGDFTAQLAADVFNGMYLEYSGEDGSTRAWVRQLSGYVTPEMFGASGIGIDDTTYIQAAINTLIRVRVTQAHSVSSLTMPQWSEIEFMGEAAFNAISDTNVLTISARNVRLFSPRIYTGGVAGFSHAAIYADGSAGIATRDHCTQIINPWLSGLNNVSEGYGIHFYSGDTVSDKLSYIQVIGGFINSFTKGIYIQKHATNGYATGCVFSNINMSGNIDHIWCEDNGHIFNNIEIQTGSVALTNRQIYCSGSFNTFSNMFLWDVTNPTSIELSAGSSYNTITVASGGSPRGLIDYGARNSVIFDSGYSSIDNIGRILTHSSYNQKIDNQLLYADLEHTVAQTSGTAPVVGAISDMFRPTGFPRWDATSTLPIVIDITFSSAVSNIEAVGITFMPNYYATDVKIELYNSSTATWNTWFENTANESDKVLTNYYSGYSLAANNITIMRITLSGLPTLASIRPLEVTMFQQYPYSRGNLFYQKNGGVVHGKVIAEEGIGVGNSAAATTPGTVTNKMEVFDETGSSLGFVPIYNTIT